MNNLKIAILGAGPSGLSAAKYAISEGLDPTIFEKSDQVGGLWIPGRTVWSSMHINSSYFTTSYSDFPWPDGTEMFPSSQQVYDYFNKYAKTHSLFEKIVFNTEITNIKKNKDNKWIVRTRNLKDNLTNDHEFDFVIIASGINNKPRIPCIPGMNIYKGKILHSSEYRLTGKDVENKRVVVLGCSSSSSEIISDLIDSGFKGELINVFEKPYLILPKIAKLKIGDQDGKPIFRILPIDFLLFNRKLSYSILNLEEKDKIKEYEKTFKELCTVQMDKSKCPSSLLFDFSKEKIRLSISDNYIQYLQEGKIKPIRSKIKKFVSDGLILDNGSFIQVDLVILGTGYDVSLDFFDSSDKDLLNYNDKTYKNPLILYENTWHPCFNNLAFVGLTRGYFLLGSELQSIWACKVFAGKLKLPSKETMQEEIDKNLKNREINWDVQFPYGDYVIIVDRLGRKLDLLPELEKLKENQNVYNMMYNNAFLPFHFEMKCNYERFLKLLVQVENLTNKVYNQEQSSMINTLNFKNEF